jgi:hypothetical protein
LIAAVNPERARLNAIATTNAEGTRLLFSRAVLAGTKAWFDGRSNVGFVRRIESGAQIRS